MTCTLVEQLLLLLDEAFEGDDNHSLLGNLRAVTAADWLWVPPGGSRSIRQIVGHVGACKYMYDNHAFGDAKMTWDDTAFVVRQDGNREELGCSMEQLQTSVALPGGDPPMGDVIEWVAEGRRRLREHVAALDDGELLEPRRTNWGELRETRWIIGVMIEHDLYHAGEINHIRALRQQNDRWAWEPS